MPADSPPPRFDDVLDAAARIAPHAIATPVLRHEALDEAAGCTLGFKAEALQRGGAFKFRGACNAVFSLGADEAPRGVVTHSSGNHGGALALAARLRGIPCHVVAPAPTTRASSSAAAPATSPRFRRAKRPRRYRVEGGPARTGSVRR